MRTPSKFSLVDGANYWPAAGYEVWRLQKFQEPLVARRYYDLLRESKKEEEDTYLNTTKLPASVSFDAIMSTDPTYVSREDFRRRHMMSVARRLGGTSQPVYWCWNCTTDFPIDNAKFVADTIAHILKLTVADKDLGRRVS